MENHYFTFGQTHVHPETGEKLKNYWVLIKAEGYSQARAAMFNLFGDKWAMQYDSEPDINIFPGGCYAVYRASEVGAGEINVLEIQL